MKRGGTAGVPVLYVLQCAGGLCDSGLSACCVSEGGIPAQVYTLYMASGWFRGSMWVQREQRDSVLHQQLQFSTGSGHHAVLHQLP